MLVPNRRFSALLLLAATTLLFGCEDDVVFRDRQLFETPPDGAGNFLGYSSVADQQTVCGNCHVGKQAEWLQTAHAGAWGSLEESGHAQDVCRDCHAVSSLGNEVTEPNVGWVATGHRRYEDVQCESCHGPGLVHVTDPDASQPLASMLAGTDMTSGCGECHQGSHTPYVEEWSQSRHGSMNAYPQGNPSCTGCHETRGIFAEWGVDVNYIEEGQAAHIPITCAVCHDPHDATNEGQMRFPIDEPSVEGNLCMMCHHKRGVPDPTTFRGPHSPQGPLLMGEAGWRPDDFVYGTAPVVATHGSEANPRLCATCHVSPMTVNDATSGEFLYQSTGHSFRAIPCLDAQGIPTTDDDCAIQQRAFTSCAAGGCHGSDGAARSAMVTARLRVDRLIAELDALLAQVPATEFVVNEVYTTAEGARFNSELGAMGGSPVHNPFLVEALLLESIRRVELDYGLAASPSLSLAPELAPR